MKRVLIVAGTFDGGGVETVIMNIVRNIDKSEIMFDIVAIREGSSKYDNELMNLGVKVICIQPISKQGLANYYKKLYSIMRNGYYDVVHINGVLSSVVALCAARSAGIKKRIYHAHNTQDSMINLIPLRPLRKLTEIGMRKLVVNSSTLMLACGREAGEFVFGKRCVESGNVKVINNAIDLNRFCFVSKVEHQKLKIKLCGRADCLVLGNAGRFTPVKNQIFTIRLVEEYLRINSKHIVLCLAGDGVELDKCKKYVTEHELTDYVMFLGNIANMDEFYKSIDLFLLPSLFEGLPVTAIEAQACGVPIIMADTITKEADLNLNIAKYISVNMPRKWLEVLVTCTMKRLYSDDLQNETIILEEYSIDRLVKEMRKLYED